MVFSDDPFHVLNAYFFRCYEKHFQGFFVDIGKVKISWDSSDQPENF